MRGPLNIERRSRSRGRRRADQLGFQLQLSEEMRHYRDGFRTGIIEVLAVEVVGLILTVAVYLVAHLNG